MIFKNHNFILLLLLVAPLMGFANHLRDPFLPTYQSSIDITQRRLSAPLQNYSLEQLKMVGFVQYENIPWAIIKTPEQYQRVKIGDNLGKNSGKITKITVKKITIIEQNTATASSGTTKIIEINRG